MAKQGLHINVYRVPGGIWRCDLKLNTSPAGEGITIRGTSEDHDGAMMGSWWTSTKAKLSKAGQAVARARITAQALLKNPVVAAAFPQYVVPALVALKAMEVAEKKGALSTVKKKLTDPTLRKVARELDEMSKGQRTAMSGGGVCLACDDAPRARMRGNSGILPGTPRGGGRADDNRDQPFGLPPANPHPWAHQVREQLARGLYADPLSVQKLARMNALQRKLARASR